MNSLGTKITELRKKSNITQDELAAALEVTRQAISQWESDTSVPKADKLKSLCEYFNVRPDYFLFEDSGAEPLVRTEDGLAAEQEIAAAKLPEEKPEKLSRKKTVLITCAVIFSLLAAAIMLFVAWLEAPTEGVAYSGSSSSWRFDIVTVLQILAGVILFAVACIIVFFIIKHVKNKRK